MNIIKKCLDELNKPEFRKDYVIGMLETLYEMEKPVSSYLQPGTLGGSTITLTPGNETITVPSITSIDLPPPPNFLEISKIANKSV